MTSKRIKTVQRKLEELKLDGFLVTHLPNVSYLSGFSGSNGLCLITRDRKIFLTDFRYREQSRQEVKGMKIGIVRDSLFEELSRGRMLRGLRRVGIEGNYIPYAEYRKLKKAFPSVAFVPSADVVESIAAVKDEEEIRNIKKAAGISDKVFEKVLEQLRPGIRELEISAEISYYHKYYGAERDAFETIVASGPRGALPHGPATDRKIRKGDFVTLDFGCVVQSYCCDITRTVAVGKPAKKLREIYSIVFDAQLQAIEAVRAGILAKDLDAVARNYISSRGYRKYFGHSLGHGIGLQVHEAPRISWLSSYPVQAGNVITIEPGIYLPGVGGVRIEDDIVVTNGACTVLNKAPKELLVL
jgi:Xaa-Pro aminopeptidase